MRVEILLYAHCVCRGRQQNNSPQVEEIPTVLKTPTAQISKYRSPFTRQDTCSLEQIDERTNATAPDERSSGEVEHLYKGSL